jgi:hemoglobin-like flavoprotein
VSDQLNDIHQTWDHIQQFNKRDELGLRIMKNLFTISPRTISLFSFRDEENLYRSQALKDHYHKVLDALGTAIKMFVQSKDIKSTLKEMGRKHRHLGVEKQQYEIFGRALMQGLDSVLKDKFTAQLKQSWIKFLMVLTSQIVSDNYEVDNSNQVPAEDLGDTLTHEKAKIVQDTWAVLKKEPNIAVAVFSNFFDLQPVAVSMLGLDEVDDMFQSDQFQNHSAKVLQSLSDIIINLQKPEALELLTSNMFFIHENKNVTRSLFESLGEAILIAAKELMGDQLTPVVRNAWECALRDLVNLILIPRRSSTKRNIEGSQDAPMTPINMRQYTLTRSHKKEGEKETKPTPHKDTPFHEKSNDRKLRDESI